MGRHHARQLEDWYKTPPAVTRALLDREEFGDLIAEPACGDGAISDILKEAGFTVYSSDLYDRNYGVSGVDFLTTTSLPFNASRVDLITNPPFGLADEFVLHAHKVGYFKMAFLLRLAWLEGEARRRKVFDRYPPRDVYVFSARQTLWRGDDPKPRSTGGMAAYAWFIFRNDGLGARLNPRLHWISRSESQDHVPATVVTAADTAREFF